MDDLARLELSQDEMKAMLDAAGTRVLAHLAGIGEAHARGDVDTARDREMCRAMKESAPENGTALEPLLDRFFDEWIPRTLTTNGPGYLAYIPGGGIFTAAIADLVADTTNRFTGTWFGAPPLVQLESNALDWLRDFMGFPDGARGLFTTGGSMATFNAIVCAREKILGSRIRDGVLYTSTQAHHSVKKSAKLAGIAADRVRAIPVDASFRMRVDALEAAIEEDTKAGLLPFFGERSSSRVASWQTAGSSPGSASSRFAREKRRWTPASKKSGPARPRFFPYERKLRAEGP